MMTYKYEIGDDVVIRDYFDQLGSYKRIGQVGKISYVDIDQNMPYRVEFKDGDFGWFFEEELKEPTPHKHPTNYKYVEEQPWDYSHPAIKDLKKNDECKCKYLLDGHEDGCPLKDKYIKSRGMK